jgi:hypothetical protein
MRTIAESLLAATPIGATVALPRAGTPLENTFVHHASALEIKELARHGRVEIVDERSAMAGDDPVIVHLAFRRLR